MQGEHVTSRLPLAIGIGLVGGLVTGLVAAVTGVPALIAIAEGVEPVGTAFVNLLKMVVIPLVVGVIFVGVCSLGDLRKLGRLGGATVGLVAGTSAIGVLLGMGVMRALLPLASETAAQAMGAGTTPAPELPGLVEFLLDLIPENPFAAAVDGALLPLIVFTVLVAGATGALPPAERDRLAGVAQAVVAALVKLVDWILYLAPIGVFALAAPVTARAGWGMLQTLAAFVLAVLLGLVLLVALVYVPLVRLLGRMSLGRFVAGATGPFLIAAGSASSAATLPAMLEAAEHRLKLSPSVTSFVVPLGSAIGRSGTALFQGASVVFLAWLFGVPIEASGVGGIVLATFIVSFTVAGIPAGGVVSLAPALGSVGVPLDGLAILLGIDRIPDMARTAVNVLGVLAVGVALDRRPPPES
ncbi:MAG: dicarboxylate/amino acid:cation symporter [Gemmatimonadota bacterium]|nr:dicarboxylate/amino acid:cation symporter [Gemmatimonadota bacterium]